MLASIAYLPQLKLLLIVYVDDFKLSGPKCNLEKAWKLIQKGIILETPTGLGLYLGCRHIQGSHKLPDGTKVFARLPTIWSRS